MLRKPGQAKRIEFDEAFGIVFGRGVWLWQQKVKPRIQKQIEAEILRDVTHKKYLVEEFGSLAAEGEAEGSEENWS